MQSSLPHAPDEVFSPEKFFSAHHGGLYMHGPKSKMHPWPASSSWAAKA